MLVKMDRSNAIPIGFLILMIMVVLPSFFGPPLYVMIIILSLFVAFFFGFSFTHGYQTLGGKAISVFLGITVVVTYVMEWLGTHFGIPFGNYYYTNNLGPLILDVPIVIPIQWFNALYVCYIMANITLSRSGNGMSASLLKQILLTSIITGLFMVSWDFINDPYMVGVGSWVWTSPIEFFGLTFYGIPLSNFLGWVFTSALTVFLFDLYRNQDADAFHRFIEKVAEPINGLVLVPYLYLLVVPVTSGFVAGLFSFSVATTLAPIGLASVTMGFAALLTAWRFNRIRTLHTEVS
jgi:uncharacterized membrane protein